MRFRVAFAACEQLPELPIDDALAVAELARRGVSVEPVIWSKPADWASFDAVVIRATWDYWLRYPQFKSWLDELELARVRVFNPIPMIRANSDKRYLRDLERRGLPIVPTEWVEPEDFEALERIASSGRSGLAILKPVVSGNAYETYRMPWAELATRRAELERIWKLGPAMVQPHLDAVETEGEVSFIYFEGELSHVVRKRPANGDFRVQKEHGGRFVRFGPPSDWVAAAAQVIATATPTPLYGRVDLVGHRGVPRLMELELIEPSLYFQEAPEAAATFADRLLARLRT